MNAVEIEAAITELADRPFDAAEFPFAFLAAFGNKETTIKRLKKGETNASDLEGGLLQRSNIHLLACPPTEPSQVSDALRALRNSPKTAQAKVKFILATDGITLEAEELASGETLACAYPEFPNHFGFFLPLAGISTVKAIKDSAIDIRATGRLNKLYVELLKDNPDWGTAARRLDLNHFMARLIFCFFAEDIDIFHGQGLFTQTVEQMSEPSGANTHTVIAEIFRAMDIKVAERGQTAPPFETRSSGTRASSPPLLPLQPPHAGKMPAFPAILPSHESIAPASLTAQASLGTRASSPPPLQPLPPHAGRMPAFPAMLPSHESITRALPAWANGFPYVNGGLFAGSHDVPRFSRITRTYLLHAGHLKWRDINPDIFGSMIQAVADDKERGALGMHYTSVPNILNVLNPLFLDELRAQLTEAARNDRKLLNLRKRLAKIRVFDPACGSGNFLVIAYKAMREIEFKINEQRGETHLKSVIPLTNFRGIELNNFPAEIARLALIIAEYQSDVRYRGQKEALAEFLPLNTQNWIICGNALRLDWLGVCPPTGTGVKLFADDLFRTPLEQSEIDFENEGGETYICGNPPYLGSTWQTAEQKDELKAIFERHTKSWKSLDYVAGWFMKAANYGTKTNASAAFVSTNSICQGQQVPILWPLIFKSEHKIAFAHTSFKWANLASYNAGVTVVIVGISKQAGAIRRLFSTADDGTAVVKEAGNINAYLVAGGNVIVEKASKPLGEQAEMSFGNKPVDGGHLLLTTHEVHALDLNAAQKERFIRRIYGSAEFIRGLERFCLWIEDQHLTEAMTIEPIKKRIEGVRVMRLASRDKSANDMAARAHQMREMNIGLRQTIAMPGVSSENRAYLPVGLLDSKSTVTNLAFALYDAPLWNMALIASRLHLVWIATVCGKLKTDFRYSNTLGWNTFPVLPLTAQNKADLTECAENILLAREMHFPATIAELYAPGKMPDNLQRAHAQNDETLERIYLGRLFKNDTERLEKLFEMYTGNAGFQPASSAATATCGQDARVPGNVSTTT